MSIENVLMHVKNNQGNIVDLMPKTSIQNVDGLQSSLSNKVDKITGKGLSTNDYTTAEKNKLSGIAEGATANIGTVTQVKIGSTAYNPSSGVVSLPAYPTTLPASDVSSWAKASSKPSYTASEVGAIATTAKGAASGVAELDANGKVPSSQLPAYVDDVLEYTAKSSFPATGETGKIYVDTSTNLTYRWSGSAYVEISPSLALGTTSSTAYRGDRGNTAYTHATDSSRLTTAQSSGLYKIATTAQGHIASVTAVEKADITGLGIPGSDTTYSVVSTSANGLAPKVTSTAKFLKGDGTWATPTNTWTAMTGATSSADGGKGYINATPPKDGYNSKYWRADGTWAVPPNTTYSAATQSADGLMSASDKTKLDGIATGATANIGTVTQVKVGTTAYNPSSGVVSLPAYPTTLPASDVSSWAKQASKPSYTYSEVGAAPESHTHTKSQITDFPTSMTPTSHTHGNIQNGGTLQTNDITIASGDKIIVTDSSNSSKIARTSISFDGSTATQALTKKGTWETFNNYSHPTSSGNKHIPSGGSSGQILRWSADGTAAWGSDNNTWTAMVGATSSANGSVGYVNAVPPKDGYNTKYLRADGSWQVPPNTTYSVATQSSNGLMSATDKEKLDELDPELITITAKPNFTINNQYSYKSNNLAWFSIDVSYSGTLTANQTFVCATVDDKTIKRGDSVVMLNAWIDDSWIEVVAFFSSYTTQEIKVIPKENVPANSRIFITGTYRFY